MAAGALLPKIFQTDWQSTSTSLVSMFAVLISLPMGTGVATGCTPCLIIGVGRLVRTPGGQYDPPLVLQLSLLVDQEFGGLSFPVAGFGDGLMEPAPERPSENEVDAELSWKRAMRRRISGMLKAMNAPDPPPPFGRRG